METNKEELKKFILTELSYTLADDLEFLDKVNRLSFGLLKKSNLRDYNQY